MEQLLNATAIKISSDLAFMVARLRQIEYRASQSQGHRTLHLLIEKRRSMLLNVHKQLRELSSRH